MLAREYLRENADAYRIALKNRGSAADIDRFLSLDTERRRTIAQVEALKNQRNVASQEIASLKAHRRMNSGEAKRRKLRSRGEETLRRAALVASPSATFIATGAGAA